ncbi:hypothetical protein CROQUDRAFT_661906 [Cronartium quercuum f. sp. fusiforme G11]|uniref:Uncharacterized protein n=1 Tax=Cronartium quercuum f. sp. fusiforme G11 TaxID=708437 RepID=A0A9P6NB79_9BASI|nr:hypothetical protein CROQUDRAFT_661906 [Cronartium quercuum f. sp. fusiforme G11]
MKKKIIVGIWVIGFIELANKLWNECFNENEFKFEDDEDEDEDDDDDDYFNNDNNNEQDAEIWLGKIGLYEKFRLKQLEKVDGIIESLELTFFSK